jgi:hypothetical protein
MDFSNHSDHGKDLTLNHINLAYYIFNIPVKYFWWPCQWQIFTV